MYEKMKDSNEDEMILEFLKGEISSCNCKKG